MKIGKRFLTSLTFVLMITGERQNSLIRICRNRLILNGKRFYYILTNLFSALHFFTGKKEARVSG